MGFVFSVKDNYRAMVEAATGGKNTVMYDDKGYPSIMVAIPRFNLSDVIDGAPNNPHPAFIVNGVVKNVIYISKYQNIVFDNRAYSLPSQDPRTYVTLDQAMSYCTAKGAGWHLMTNAEWAAIALWCKKNNKMPRGNNNYGKDITAAYERGAVTYRYESSGVWYDGRVATGSGPASWSHDGTDSGIYGLNGNVWEWNHGLKAVDGKIWVLADNNFTVNNVAGDVTGWMDTASFFDVDAGNLVLNGSVTTPMVDPDYKSRTFESLPAKAGFVIPDILKHLAIAPIDASHGGDSIYVRNYGERLALRGGLWSDGSGAGVFALYLNTPRSDSGRYVGFRSAFCAL